MINIYNLQMNLTDGIAMALNSFIIQAQKVLKQASAVKTLPMPALFDSLFLVKCMSSHWSSVRKWGSGAWVRVCWSRHNEDWTDSHQQSWNENTVLIMEVKYVLFFFFCFPFKEAEEGARPNRGVWTWSSISKNISSICALHPIPVWQNILAPLAQHCVEKQLNN